MKTVRPPAWSLLTLLLLTACVPVSDNHENLPDDSSSGLVTILILNFTPATGGDPLSFSWTAPEGDGEAVVDPIPLPDRTDHNHHDTQAYTLDVELWNDEGDPALADIEDAADEFQLFFTGSAVEGPATGPNSEAVIVHEYDDSDSTGLPVGLENTVETLAWGSGLLTVTLQHMPPQDGDSVKVAALAEDVARDGFDAIGGESALQVSFEIEVE